VVTRCNHPLVQVESVDIGVRLACLADRREVPGLGPEAHTTVDRMLSRLVFDVDVLSLAIHVQRPFVAVLW